MKHMKKYIPIGLVLVCLLGSITTVMADIDTDSDFVVWVWSDSQDLSLHPTLSSYYGNFNATFADVNESNLVWDFCFIPGDIGSGENGTDDLMNSKWVCALNAWNNYSVNLTRHNTTYMIPVVGNHESDYHLRNQYYALIQWYNAHNPDTPYYFDVEEWGWYPYHSTFNGTTSGKNYNYTFKMGDTNLAWIMWSGNKYNHSGGGDWTIMENDRVDWMYDAVNDTEGYITFLVNHYGIEHNGLSPLGTNPDSFKDQSGPWFENLVNASEWISFYPFGHVHSCRNAENIREINGTLFHNVASLNRNRETEVSCSACNAPVHYFYTFDQGSKVCNIRCRNSYTREWCSFNLTGNTINKHGYNFTMPMRFSWYTKSAPAVSNPLPTNNSIDNNISLYWNCSINDTEGNLFNYTIQCNNSQNVSQDGVSNGTKSLSLTGLSYNTTYTVWVNATDGHNETRDVFTFKTENEPAVISYDYCIEYYRPINDGTGNTVFTIIGFLMIASAVVLLIGVIKIRGIL